jgi:argininosuccinate lyase
MKMWDGRFAKPSDSVMEELNSSLHIDKRLIEEDVAGSIAWAEALRGCGVLSSGEHGRIVAGLRAVLEDHNAGKSRFKACDEDVHMAMERLLVEKIGETGAKLHTGRSRNDQVATDTRLHVKKRYGSLRGALLELQKALLSRAETDRRVIMPGYTHLQQAQPILLSHYWLSFLFAIEREKTRCANASALADVMPLGSGAMAGAGFSVDRRKLARVLGFRAISPNSVDAVASRDFVLDALACCASISILLSRYAEDLIIWSSREFNFIELDDAWSTGSSMMPQKKNPDSLELVRSKAGRCIGNYTAFAATLKGVGLAYYKDLQEDKEPLLDSFDHVHLACAAFSGVLKTLIVKAESMRHDLDPFLFATDLADYLVDKNMPFRKAHKVVGKIVAYCIDNGCDFRKLTLSLLKEFSPLFEKDVTELFQWKRAIMHRNIDGGTGYGSVKKQIVRARTLVGGE